MNLRTSALLALILLAAIGMIPWPRGASHEPDGSHSANNSTLPNPSHWSSGSSTVPSKLPRDQRPRTPHLTHSAEELKDFIIPTLQTKDATIHEALAALFEQYNEICLNTGETPLTFHYRIKGDPTSPLNLQLQQTSFLRTLSIIAAQSGLVLGRDGTELVFEGSTADQARLNAFLEDEFLNTPPILLKTTTKIIESTEPITFQNTRFSDVELQDVMRSLAQTKGVDILTQPSVFSRPGQPATIESIREVLISDPDHAGQFLKDWTGIRMQGTSGGYGFDLQSNIVHEFRETVADSPDTIKGVTASTSQHQPAGNTVLIETTSPAGTPVYIFTTTQRLDATGRPYDPRNPGE